MIILLEFVGSFLFILVFGYLLPAGHFYYKYHIRQNPGNEQLRIQERRPTAEGVRREVRLSLISILIFAVLTTVLLQLYAAGKTSIYRNPRQYPLYYLPLSFVICAFLFDTYFYWTHRFMHWRPVFKYIHVGHHRSISPTPWAIFAFQPLEALIQFFAIILLVVFLPMHPLIFLLFLWYDTLVNTAGHTGYEILPKAISGNWLFKGLNTVTHHDAHHRNMRVNFGSFFNIWDRLMGTFWDETAPLARVGVETDRKGVCRQTFASQRHDDGAGVMTTGGGTSMPQRTG